MFNSMLCEFKLDEPIVYILYGILLAFVVAESLYYLIKSMLRAKKLGMDMGKISKVITTSISFSILPAVGIAIGVATLVGTLGIAFPAIRLSVIGSLQYETQMADGVAKAITQLNGVPDGGLKKLIGNITAQDFVTIASIMTIAIIAGPILVTLFYKRFQPKVAMLNKKSGSAKGGVNLGELAFQIIFIGMVIGYLAISITSIAGKPKFVDSYFNFIAIIVAAICMYSFDLLIKITNWKWLDNFSTAFSMIIAMVVVGIISYFAYTSDWPLTPDPQALTQVIAMF